MEGTRRRPVWAVCATVVVAAAVLSLLWTDTASTQQVATPEGWRCYPAKQPKGSPKFEPVDIVLNGTLQRTTGQALKPVLFCDPVNEPSLNATQRPSLVCYSIKDDSGTPKFPGETVEVASLDVPFDGSLTLKKSKTVCVFAFRQPGPL